MLERDEVTLASGQIENVEIIVDTPTAENLEGENKNIISNDYTVKVTRTGVSAETSFRLIAQIGEEPSEEPWGIIAAAIVIIVIIAAAAYFTLKRKRGHGKQAIW